MSSLTSTDVARFGPNARGDEPRMDGRAAVIRYQFYSDADGRREAEALASAGLETTLLCLRRPGEPRLETLGGVEIRRFRCPKRRGGPVQYLVDYGCWFAICLTWLTIEQFRRPFDVVQVTTLPDFQILAAAPTRLRGAKIVLFVKEPASELIESTGGPHAMASAMRAVTRVATERADLVFAVTREHRELLISLGSDGSRIEVVENTPPPEFLGVDRRSRRPSTTCTVVCHGTIEERYGHATIVHAARILRERGHDVRVVMTGSGTFAPELRRLISSLGLDDVVEVPGFVTAEELAELLSSASIGVVAQYSSSYSNVVHTQKMFEFFSLGIPVVASRLRSVENYFADAVEFFEPADATSLADAIARLIEDPARCERLVAAADTAYERLEWPRLRRRYLRAIATVVGGK